MTPNRILERMRNGDKALGLAMTQPSEEMVELAALMGLDYVTFDGQHSPQTPEVIERMCRVADALGITAGMRVPDGRESTLLSYLDRGIKQITVPNLQTKEEADALVKYTYFAPKGLRSSTSLRMAFQQNGPDRGTMMADANANTILNVQIESVTALENLDEILTVDGLDYFGAGSEDMAQSMGMPGQHSHPRVLEAYAQAEKKVRGAGKHWFSDVTEDINVFLVTMEASAALLEKHGRKSQLWA